MLGSLARVLDLKEVHITGSVNDEQLFAYYRVASVFVSMSEHEGFCLPLLESMYFGLPVVAYAGAAVPWTMGGSGVLFKEKDLPLVAGLIDCLQKNERWREEVLAGQRRRLASFSRHRLQEQLLGLLSNWLGVRL